MADWEDENKDSGFSPADGNRGRNSRVYRPSGRGGGRGGGNSSNDSNWRSRENSDRDNRSGGDNRYNRGGNSYRRPEGNRKEMSVPSTKVGRIIGKGGSKIRELEFDSEAKIKIGDSDGNTTDITLFGTDEAICKAEAMINELAEDYKPFSSREE